MPGLFAAAAFHSAVPCGAAYDTHDAGRVMAEGPLDQRTDALALEARAAAGANARLPALVIHGSEDPTVSPANGNYLVRQFLLFNGMVELPPGNALPPTATRAVNPRGFGYILSEYYAGRRLAVRLLTVPGLGHAWSSTTPAATAVRCCARRTKAALGTAASSAPITRGPTISVAGWSRRRGAWKHLTSTPEDFPLHAVAVQSWGGFVFVHLGANPAPFAEAISDSDQRFRSYDFAALRIGKRIVADVQANWKLLAENFSECFHCPPVHPELCSIVTAYQEAGAWGLRPGPEAKLEYKPGAVTLTMDGSARLPAFAGLNAEARQTLYIGEMMLPSLFLNVHPDYVNAHI